MSSTKYKSEKFWDRVAAGYDSAEAGDRQKMQLTLNAITKHLNPTDEVLDIGCGTALVTCQIAMEVKSVTGIDISSKMLEKAHERANSFGLNNIRFAQADVFQKTLTRQAYDVILANYIIHLLDKPENHLKRAYQLLKPGGLFISVTPCMKEKPFLAGSLKLLSKIGLAPELKAFSLEKLESIINNHNWQIMERIKISESDPEYLIVAKKP